MAYEEKGPTLVAAHILHFTQAFFLKAGIPNCQYLIHHQDLRLQMSRYGEGQTYIHAAAVALHRCVQKTFHLGKRHNLIEFGPDLGPAHAQDGAI